MKQWRSFFLTLSILACAPFLCATVLYVDPAATGSNNGGDWTNAWTSLQSAADSAVAGDTVYCRGTQTLAARIDFDTKSGTGVYIQFVGVNASGTEDGTKFVLDGNSAAANCIYSNQSALMFRNFELKNATGDGFLGASFQYGAFVNCYFHSNGQDGINVADARYFVFFKCSSVGNTQDGYSRFRTTQFRHCEAIGNGGIGFDINDMSSVTNCLSHNNTGDGVDFQSALAVGVDGCVIDGNAIGIDANDTRTWIAINNRLTNNTGAGIDVDVGAKGYEDYNFYSGNGAAITNAGTTFDQGPNSLTSGVVGYYDIANDTFNLVDSASLRRVAIPIGAVDSANLYYGTAGLPPADTACAGGGVSDTVTITDTVTINDTLYIYQGGKYTPYRNKPYR